MTPFDTGGDPLKVIRLKGEEHSTNVIFHTPDCVSFNPGSLLWFGGSWYGHYEGIITWVWDSCSKEPTIKLMIKWNTPPAYQTLDMQISTKYNRWLRPNFSLLGSWQKCLIIHKLSLRHQRLVWVHKLSRRCTDNITTIVSVYLFGSQLVLVGVSPRDCSVHLTFHAQ